MDEAEPEPLAQASGAHVRRLAGIRSAGLHGARHPRSRPPLTPPRPDRAGTRGGATDRARTTGAKARIVGCPSTGPADERRAAPLRADIASCHQDRGVEPMKFGIFYELSVPRPWDGES